jgi:hypothetical protein
MIILGTFAVILITIFVLFTAYFMWSEGDILQGIVWSFLSAGLLIQWYGVIFNG